MSLWIVARAFVCFQIIENKTGTRNFKLEKSFWTRKKVVWVRRKIQIFLKKCLKTWLTMEKQSAGFSKNNPDDSAYGIHPSMELTLSFDKSWFVILEKYHVFIIILLNEIAKCFVNDSPLNGLMRRKCRWN